MQCNYRIDLSFTYFNQYKYNRNTQTIFRKTALTCREGTRPRLANPFCNPIPYCRSTSTPQMPGHCYKKVKCATFAINPPAHLPKVQSPDHFATTKQCPASLIPVQPTHQTPNSQIPKNTPMVHPRSCSNPFPPEAPCVFNPPRLRAPESSR